MDFFILLSIWRWLTPILLDLLHLVTAFFTWNNVFWFVATWRYLRLIVHCIAHWIYKSVPLPEKPKADSNDVTVIIPTIHNNFEELRPALQSILATQPAKLILVTTTAKVDQLQDFAETLNPPTAEVHHVRIANKRLQICEVIPLVATKYTVLADDDVTWPKTIIPWLLAPFEKDPKMGAVGPCQRVTRLEDGPLSSRIWNWLGAAYIERRNFEISATHRIDGGTSCMSGRTCFFRTDILRDPLFLDGFKNEHWGSYQLNADDDNFITRWLVSHQYNTWIQYNRECEIETTLENNPNFLRQCTRWARSNWRSNWTSMVTERYVWRLVSPSNPCPKFLLTFNSQQRWSVYALHMATFTSLAFVVDPFLVYSCYRASASWGPTGHAMGLPLFLCFMAFSKVVKLVGLFIRNPSNIFFLPVSVLFGWFHGLIKLHALLTLREVCLSNAFAAELEYLERKYTDTSVQTSWGSRADGDLDDNARMKPRRRAESIANPAPGQKGLIRYINEQPYVQDRRDFPERTSASPVHEKDLSIELRPSLHDVD